MNLKTSWRLWLFIALNASAGISFAPGDLLFFRPLSALVNSFHVRGSSRVGSISRWVMVSRAVGETGFLLLKSFFVGACSLSVLHS